LVFAPVVEELAWHSYGTDTLRSRFNLFNTCMIFAVYWVIWHLPLSFIKGYYHSNIVAEGWIYSLNFVFSLFVFVVLMNWLYYKTNRNILITIFFHLSANISNEIFATHPMSKVIQTGILLIVSFLVLYKDRKMFFEKI
jgi:membrane protease YdiL (CAAX protease family)